MELVSKLFDTPSYYKVGKLLISFAFTKCLVRILAKTQYPRDSVEIPTRCGFVIEFIIPKFIEGSTCFEWHTAQHQEL
jgi:hypothetical protein